MQYVVILEIADNVSDENESVEEACQVVNRLLATGESIRVRPLSEVIEC